MIKNIFRSILFFLYFFSFTACKQQTNTSFNSSVYDNFDPTSTDSLYCTFFSIDTTDAACTSEIGNCPSAKISYPIFSTPDSLLDSFLNNEVMKIILYESDTSTYNSTKDYLKKFFAENIKYKSNDASDAWHNERIVSVYDKIGKYITIKSYSEFYEGGAHPNSNINYKVYDLISKKELKLNELLNINNAALLKFGEYYFRKNNKVPDSTTLADANYFIFGDGEDFEDGPKYGKFQFNTNFALTKNGIEFEYNPYEIGPYAVGSSSFTIPYKDVQTYLKLKIW